jgi:hypothetical protein
VIWFISVNTNISPFNFSKISNSARNGAKCTQVWIKTEIKSGAAKGICSSALSYTEMVLSNRIWISQGKPYLP